MLLASVSVCLLYASQRSVSQSSRRVYSPAITTFLDIPAYRRRYSGNITRPCLSTSTSIAPASMSLANARELDCPRGKPANLDASLSHSSLGNRNSEASTTHRHKTPPPEPLPQ